MDQLISPTGLVQNGAHLRPFIRLSRVSKQFRSHDGSTYTAFDDLNLDLREGELFCLLGPSGCGKTSVLNIVAGFEAKSSGTVEIDGKEITRPSAERGVVFQADDSLFGWLTAMENVEFGLRLRGMRKAERREIAAHYLNMVGLSRAAGKYPSELSGGMKQRVQLARVLAGEPRVLLMDEPFGALDAHTRSLMQQQLVEIWSKSHTSVLFITHDLEEAAMLATRVGVMRAGPSSTIKAILEIDLPHPRQRTSDEFTREYRRVYDAIAPELASRED